MIRTQIIQTAVNLFAQKGISAVSIEQIAAEMGISEKSIYMEFSEIEKVLDECINHKIDKITEAISTAQSISQSALEALILVLNVVLKEKSAFCNSFYTDLNKYPIIRKQLAIFNMQIQDKCGKYFVECIEEGYFISNENRERMALIYLAEISSLAAKYQHAMIKTLLKGICTSKGLDEASRIQAVLEIKKSKIESTNNNN